MSIVFSVLENVDRHAGIPKRFDMWEGASPDNEADNFWELDPKMPNLDNLKELSE